MQQLSRILLLLALPFALFWWLAPREPAPLVANFEPRKFGEGVQVYFESIESTFPDVTPGTQKRIVWQPAAYERRTPVSVLYVHGFSATSEELRPVPDRIADALGANLVYTRLAGHGLDGAALAEASVADWMGDMAEGLAAARAVGEQVVVIASSTGATLATAAALDPVMAEKLAAMIFVSPNFGLKSAGSGLLTVPAARTWLPWVLGETRSWEPENEMQNTFWTTQYPVTALLPMAALVQAVRATDVSRIKTPTLFWYAEADQVVDAAATGEIAGRWGGPAKTRLVTVTDQDDPAAHVIAGDILSPAQTDTAVAEMVAWLRPILGLQ